MKTKQEKEERTLIRTHSHDDCKMNKSAGSGGGSDDGVYGNSIIFSMYKYVDVECSGSVSVSGNSTLSSAPPLTLVIETAHWTGDTQSNSYIHLYYTPSQPYICMVG